MVIRTPGPKSDSHRFIAVDGSEVIGYYRTPEEASKAYNENRETTKGKNKKTKANITEQKGLTIMQYWLGYLRTYDRDWETSSGVL